MRLSVRGMTIAAGLLWGAAILCVGLIHMADPGYGGNFLQLTSSVYPGFHSAGTAGSLAIGTIEGLLMERSPGLCCRCSITLSGRAQKEAQTNR